jgi:hypothetical protein
VFPKQQSLFYLLTGFQRASGGELHLGSIDGNHPPIPLSDLIVSPVNRIDRVGVHQL